MPRMRMLKPSFFANDVLAEVSPLGRLLFQGLWCMADREGRLEDRPKKIKAEILRYDTANIERLLADLSDRGFITRYEIGGARFIQVVNFSKHQSPNAKEPASIIPAPPEHQPSTVLALPEHDPSIASRAGVTGTGTGTEGGQEQHDDGTNGAALELVPRSIPKPNRSSEVIDAIRALGQEPNLTARDHAALKGSTAKPDLIAEVYCAVFRGDYGDEFMQRRLSVHEAIGWIDGYRSRKTNGVPKPGRALPPGPTRVIDRTGVQN